MNSLNDINPRDPWMGLYLAIGYIRKLNYQTDFPVERKSLFHGYKECCGKFPDVKPLTQNVFTIVTNTILLSDGYIVSTVKHPGNKYVAVLEPVPSVPRNTVITSSNERTLNNE